jgi:phi LC3 family holin
MKINWKVRVLSVKFWLAIGPAVFLLVQALLAPMGIKLDLQAIGVQWAAIINAAAGVLMLLGVVIDPTTAGVSDSDQAQTYGKLTVSKGEQQDDDIMAQLSTLRAEVAELKKGADKDA